MVVGPLGRGALLIVSLEEGFRRLDTKMFCQVGKCQDCLGEQAQWILLVLFRFICFGFFI